MNNKHVVSYLLTFAAIKLLASIPANTSTKKLAQSAFNQMRARYSDNDVKGVELIARILESLTRQLSTCQNTDELERAFAYVEALEKGDVLVAKENGLVTQTGEEYIG